jgi:hypothetical protein
MLARLRLTQTEMLDLEPQADIDRSRPPTGSREGGLDYSLDALACRDCPLCSESFRSLCILDMVWPLRLTLGTQAAMEASKAGIREFEMVAAKGWEDGVSLDELLARVNRGASKLFPAGKVKDARLSPVLVARTFRHYTTLGCIDPGCRVGRRVVYGYRQFVQALLVRRLLVDGVPTRRMPELVSGSDNQELRGMILGGVEVIVRRGSEENGPVANELPLDGSALPRSGIGSALHLVSSYMCGRICCVWSLRSGEG